MPTHFVLEIQEDNNLVAVIVARGQDITSEELPKIKQALSEHLDEPVEVKDLPVINKNKVYVGTATKEGVEEDSTEEVPYTLSPVTVY